jgi:hypothetical protein
MSLNELLDKKIWKTKMEMNVAKGHRAMKIWRSTLRKFIKRKNYKKQLLSLIWIKIHSKPCKCRHWDSIFTANTNLKDHMSSPHQNNKEKCLQWHGMRYLQKTLFERSHFFPTSEEYSLQMLTLWCDICRKHYLRGHISSAH